MAQASGFNKANVMASFYLLENLVDKYSFNALTIYNVDESGFLTVQKKNQKVISLKGKHQVGGISSGERGVNMTVVCCGSASGTIVTISDTGYINSELFVKRLKHFIHFIKPTKKNMLLLLLDGHTTHSKNLAALDLT